jgi:hypothetical protein
MRKTLCLVSRLTAAAEPIDFRTQGALRVLNSKSELTSKSLALETLATPRMTYRNDRKQSK